MSIISRQTSVLGAEMIARCALIVLGILPHRPQQAFGRRIKNMPTTPVSLKETPTKRPYKYSRAATEVR
jgi:hypothetical protein